MNHQEIFLKYTNNSKNFPHLNMNSPPKIAIGTLLLKERGKAELSRGWAELVFREGEMRR